MHAHDWLQSARRNEYSKSGEDGILEKIFEIIKEESRTCVELGALTGSYGSNTRHLIKDCRWTGVLIEAERAYFEILQQEYSDDKGVECVNAFVSFNGENSLDSILARTSLPLAFDFLSLDIDGDDYHIWDSLHTYRPRVAVIEFNPTIPNAVSFVQPRDMAINQGSSLRSLVELGKKKGYQLVATTEDNAFFVLNELFPKFDMDNTSLDAVHPDTSKITYFFQLYDGTIKIVGNKTLLWHHIPIEESKLQLIPKSRRRFPNHITPSDTMRSLKYAARKTWLYPLVQRIRKTFSS